MWLCGAQGACGWYGVRAPRPARHAPEVGEEELDVPRPARRPLPLDEGGKGGRAGGEEESVGVDALSAADHERGVAAPEGRRGVAGCGPARGAAAQVEEAARRRRRVLGGGDDAGCHWVSHHPLRHRPERVPEGGAAGHDHRVPGAGGAGSGG